LNPQHFTALSADSAFNTAVSFVTNTDWQGYSGESAMSYFSQAAGLSLQNFLSAASGLTVAVVMVRGFKRFNSASIGNFWVDVTRASLYLLLPLALIFSVFLMGQGVIQNLNGDPAATTLEAHQQTLPMGPVASQEAIKELAPMEAVSSTPTRPTVRRIRRR